MIEGTIQFADKHRIVLEGDGPEEGRTYAINPQIKVLRGDDRMTRETATRSDLTPGVTVALHGPPKADVHAVRITTGATTPLARGRKADAGHKPAHGHGRDEDAGREPAYAPAPPRGETPAAAPAPVPARVPAHVPAKAAGTPAKARTPAKSRAPLKPHTSARPSAHKKRAR